MKCPHCNNTIEVRLSKGIPETPANDGPDDLETMLACINEEDLDEPSAKFVRETRERFEQYGDRTRISPKQLAWLKRLANENDVPF